MSHVLDRLVSGRFVADRKPVISLKDAERRQVFSPLNVTRRAIRYEPLVFGNRKQLVIDCCHILNDFTHKLLMISGPSGRGKSSFVRGLCEMLGGGHQQLLWFDVSAHTDQDEIVRFLIEYMTYVLREFGDQAKTEEAQKHQADLRDTDPFVTLMQLLEQSSHIPIVIVIDNVDFIVSSRQTIRSVELKDTLNFLLGYDNVKLIFSGTQMPLADMSPLSPLIHHMELPKLAPQEGWTIIQRHCDLSVGMLESEYRQLIHYCDGEPFAIYLLSQFARSQPDFHYWLSLFEVHQGHIYNAFLAHLLNSLTPQETKLLGLFSLINHSITATGLKALVGVCMPELRQFSFTDIEHSDIHVLMQKVFPPQLVLDQLRNRQREREALAQGNRNHRPIEAFYQLWERFRDTLKQVLPPEMRALYHSQLQQFYIEERNKPLWKRVYQARTRHLLTEAQYHSNQVKKLEREGYTSQNLGALAASASGQILNTAPRAQAGSPEQPPFATATPTADTQADTQVERSQSIPQTDTAPPAPPVDLTVPSPSAYDHADEPTSDNEAEWAALAQHLEAQEAPSDENPSDEDPSDMDWLAAVEAENTPDPHWNPDSPPAMPASRLTSTPAPTGSTTLSQPIIVQVQAPFATATTDPTPSSTSSSHPATQQPAPVQPPTPAVDHGSLTDTTTSQPTTVPPLEPPAPTDTATPIKAKKPAVPKLPDWLDAALKAFSPLPMAVQGRLKPLAFAVHGTDTRVGGNALYELIAQLVGQRHPHELTPAQLDAIEQLYIGTLQWLDQQPGLAKDDLLPVRLRLALGRFYKTHYHHNQALSELSAVFTSLSKHPSPPPDLMAATASAIGGIHAYRQHWPSAVKAFRQALRYTPDSNPQKADHAFQLALCFEGMGQLKLAIEAYHDSYKLALDQQNPVACAAALYNLGCLYWDHQAFKKAKTIFEKCLIFDEQHDAA
ncbi:MAG: hypothetical protein KC476_09510, partial [Cyanobacteria bacterium HKST-UBA06]|nr:hypothetical protein [Cyanobacteria bacterium HKST-UBA06]